MDLQVRVEEPEGLPDEEGRQQRQDALHLPHPHVGHVGVGVAMLPLGVVLLVVLVDGERLLSLGIAGAQRSVRSFARRFL